MPGMLSRFMPKDVDGETENEKLWRYLKVTLSAIWTLQSLVTIATKVKKYITPHVALVRMEGVVVSKGSSSGSSICLQYHKEILERAFKRSNVKAVVILMNSPGGSPVQASKLHNLLKSLRKQYPNKPLLCIVEDCAASAGYYIACAADEIYCDHSSIVGSIGVISASFGLKGTIQKMGIERRIHCTGKNKSQLDPFLDEKPAHVRRRRYLLDELLGAFISVVKKGRGDRLKPDIAAKLSNSIEKTNVEVIEKNNLAVDFDESSDFFSPQAIQSPGLFDGSYYDGRSALRIGLVDGIFGGIEDEKEDKKETFLTLDELLKKRFSNFFLGLEIEEMKPKPLSIGEKIRALGLDSQISNSVVAIASALFLKNSSNSTFF